MFSSNSNMYPSDVTWYRVPTYSASGDAGRSETDFDSVITTNQVYFYFALRTANPTITASTNPLTYAPNLKVTSIANLFANSAFNTESGATGNSYGFGLHIVNGVYHIILMQPYQIDGLTITPVAASTPNSCPSGSSIMYNNCAIRYGALRIAADGNSMGPANPFFSTFKINFILWWMVCTTLFYFFWALGSDSKDILQPEHEDNRFFNHPFYSSWVFGTQLQTKVSRITLIFVSMATMLFGCCFMHYYLRNESVGTRVGATIPVALAFSWVMVHFLSYFLNKLKQSHYNYMDQMKAADNHEKKLEAENDYDNQRSKWNYLFYGLSFGIVMGSYWGGIGMTINFTNTRFWWLMLSYGIVIFGEYLLLDYVCVALGKGEGGLAKWVQSRGYFIDYGLHRKWDDFLSTIE